ncbi:hypothetical protein WJX73_008371 [Symbiochloris irregularis]|uniref:Uncharacterized protein n=1 Tax=Symbiochloris irregularis TaxID=706552 RepID=A0AAW1PG89_9CHLO
MRNRINRLTMRDTGSQILIVKFANNYNSVRMLLPRVVGALAQALRIVVPKLIVFALYERVPNNYAPLMACCCEDLPAILRIIEIARKVLD